MQLRNIDHARAARVALAVLRRDPVAFEAVTTDADREEYGPLRLIGALSAAYLELSGANEHPETVEHGLERALLVLASAGDENEEEQNR